LFGICDCLAICRVADIDPEDLEELYLLRLLLETTAVRLTFPTLNSAAIAEMRGFIAQMDHYGGDRDWAGLRGPHKAFHMKLVSGGGLRIVTLVDALFDQAERYRQASFGVPIAEWAERQEEHQKLVDAAIEGDADLAVELLTAHYMRSAEMVMGSLDSERKLDRIRSTLAFVPS